MSEIDPGSGQPLATALLDLAHGDGGWLDQLSAMVGEPGQHATCGQVLAVAGRYAEAADQFGAAAAFYPAADEYRGAAKPPEMQVRLWLEQVWWNLAAGRTNQAMGMAGIYARHAGAATREGAFFRRVGALPVDFE